MRSLLLVALVGYGAPAVTPSTPSWVEDTSVLAPPPPLVPPAFRLPGDVRPTHYELDLGIVPAAPTARGKVHIAARVVRPTSVVWLHAEELGIASAAIDGAPVPTTQHGAFLGLVAPAPLIAGEHALDITFTTPIDKERSRGLYSVKEADGADYAYTFFEPTDARRAFPCFDEPEYKVPWKLIFHVARDHRALGNAPVIAETPEAGGTVRVELADSKPLPSYLVAYIVGPFELVDAGTAGRAATPLRFAIPKGRAGELGWARQITSKVVAELEAYFDMDYPYGKLDVAVVPRFWGTMEHPGLVAMGQPLTLIRGDQETRERKQRYANILAHELAHYWFGDLVTLKWWDDTWLNEALGEWMDMIITQAVEPAWRFRDGRAPYAAWAMENDETLSTQTIRRPVTTVAEIESSFDGAITYAKGSAVFRMFEAYTGAGTWRAFIRAYVARHAWGNASADDFLGLARQQLGAPVEAGLRSFLEQPGVPRISVTCDAGTLTISQVRALPAGTVDPQPKQWKVPVCVRYGDATRADHRCVFLDGPQATVGVGASCPRWLLPNADGLGYYRSVVDPVVARQLLDPASALARVARPTPSEKQMVLADQRAAVGRDELSIDRLLALLPVVAADPDDTVANAAFAVPIRFELLDDADHARAQRYLVRTFGGTARRLGWQRDKADSDERHERRKSALAAVAGRDPVLARQADQLVDRWLADRTGVADDLVPTVLALAVERGGRARFEQVLAAAAKPRDREELARLLTALGATSDPALARRAFELVRDKQLDLRDATPMLTRLLTNRATGAVTFGLIEAHLDELLARMRDDEASWLLTSLAGVACDAAYRARVTALVVPRAARVGAAKAPVERALEQATQCTANFTRQLPVLKRFLASY